MIKKRAAVLLLVVFAAFSLTGCIKIVKTGEEGKLTGQTAFNADSDVGKIWDAQVIPELTQKAVALKDFLTEANGDLKSLDEKYGKYSMGSSGELNYVIKGAAKVTAIDQKKRAGSMQVQLDGYSGKETVKIQIGTVFKGSSVRDSLDCIKYEDFKNQVQWAAVSQSLNGIVQKKVIDSLKVESLTGKTVTFVGCFTVDGNDKILITPVQMSVQ